MAHAADRVIGNKGSIPWQGQMSEDMRRFKKLTSGHAVIMGRATYDSLKSPLINRQNIVLSRTVTRLAGCDVVSSLEAAYSAAAGQEEVFIIGGSAIYHDAIPGVERMFITKIDAKFEGDTHFQVDYENGDWALTESLSNLSDSENRYPCTYLTYERSRNA